MGAVVFGRVEDGFSVFVVVFFLFVNVFDHVLLFCTLFGRRYMAVPT